MVLISRSVPCTTHTRDASFRAAPVATGSQVMPASAELDPAGLRNERLPAPDHCESATHLISCPQPSVVLVITL